MQKFIYIFLLFFSFFLFKNSLHGANSRSWWNKIEPYNIYIGAFPLNNKGHLTQISNLGVTKILSLIEDFELKDTRRNKPIKPEEFENQGISVEHIPAVDCHPLTTSQIESSINIISQMLEEGHTIYVHCRAGIGRSPSAVLAYLMAKEGLTFEEAYTLVKTFRPQINLKPSQRQALLDYFKINKPQKNPPLSTTEWINTVSESGF